MNDEQRRRPRGHGGEVPSAVRVAAVLWVIIGVGWGVFCIPAMFVIGGGGGVPIVLGLPAYGLGPFEEVGIATTVPLLAGFLIVCISQSIAGVLLWRGSRRGAILSFIGLPFGLVYWWGFALPIPPLMAVVSTVLIASNWARLTRASTPSQPFFS